MDAPHRRFRASIIVHADTREALVEALAAIEQDVLSGQPGPFVSGSAASGHTVALEDDPTMTPARYAEAVRAWIDGEVVLDSEAD
jgi:hypothetical protein